MNFKDLNLKPEIFKWIEKLGYTEPTKIQEEVILESVNGKNIIGQSQTGTGKTAAFVISLLEKIDLTKPWVQALILAPTRELVTQIKEEIQKLSSFMYIRSLGVYGWDRIGKQIDMLKKWQTIVVGTPWRTIDLIERWALRTKEITFFVLDEADRMLDMGFVDDIDFIWWTMPNLEQSMAFSATITDDLKSIIQKYLWVDYTFIKSTNELTVDKIDHSFVEIPHIEKYDALKKTIITSKSKRTIVFVETKRDTEVLARKLEKDWFSADFLNWDMRQRERFAALKDFQEWRTDIFVVTDVAARWINVKNIELVVNYHVPRDPESYIHRIGRTGRAWAEWKAVMFVDKDESFAFKNIEKRNKITIKQTDEEWNEIERKREERRPYSNSRNTRWWGRYWSRDSSRSWGYSSRSSSSRYSDSRNSNESWNRYERTGWERKERSNPVDSWFDRPKSSYFDNKSERAPRNNYEDRWNSRENPREWRRFDNDRWDRKPSYAWEKRFSERDSNSRWEKIFWEKKVDKPFNSDFTDKKPRSKDFWDSKDGYKKKDSSFPRKKNDFKK